MKTLVELVRDNVIGANAPLQTHFGQKPLVYADYTASGRGLNIVEDYIRDQVLPWYANTHTETSYTGAQTTALREQSRQIIRHAVNAHADDKVIFCGPGATAAINKLIDILNIRIPASLDKDYHFSQQIPEENRPVVFIGPYEHHSNELPWRESIADVVSIPFDRSGQIDAQKLQEALAKYRSRPLKIGSFSAASNVTGIRTNVSQISHILKQNGALSFWDYAAAGPYVSIDMNADTPIDGVFISPHKFVGGPGTPGILVAKAQVLTNEIPSVVGGGTVLYVTPKAHRFISDHERREEGGTPAIVESIRAGLVFKLQHEVGLETIHEKESSFIDRATKAFKAISNIEILGGTDAERLSIFSLRFKHNGKDLHYGFVTALLNDLFGIQVRGGCSCAGPYGHILLGMDQEYSQKIENEIQQGSMVLRPGWVRLNFNYFISEDEFRYILKAIELVAEYGWRLLPFYQLDEKNAVWRFQGKTTPLISSLQAFSFLSMPKVKLDDSQPNFALLLQEAKRTLVDTPSNWVSYSLNLRPSAEQLRWFALPQDCIAELSNAS